MSRGADRGGYRARRRHDGGSRGRSHRQHPRRLRAPRGRGADAGHGGRWRAAAPCSPTTRRRCRRARCGSSAAFTFHPVSGTRRRPRSTAWRTSIAAARSTTPATRSSTRPFPRPKSIAGVFGSGAGTNRSRARRVTPRGCARGGPMRDARRSTDPVGRHHHRQGGRLRDTGRPVPLPSRSTPAGSRFIVTARWSAESASPASRGIRRVCGDIGGGGRRPRHGFLGSRSAIPAPCSSTASVSRSSAPARHHVHPQGAALAASGILARLSHLRHLHRPAPRRAAGARRVSDRTTGERRGGGLTVAEVQRSFSAPSMCRCARAR